MDIAPRERIQFPEISVSHQADEFITCHSCDFRYPQSRGLCVMCGTAPRTTTPVQASSEAVSRQNEYKPAQEATLFGAHPRQQVEKQGPGKSIGIGIAVAVVLLVPLFLVIHNWQLSQSAEPVAAAVNTATQANTQPITPPEPAARKPVREVGTQVPAKQKAQLEVATPAVADDPAELWKSVKSGSARAEVSLARLYLAGNSVPQSCEQTHMLLLAASKKGYKAADNLLTGAYVERCPQSSTR
jgi:hypothetical protein